MRKCRIFSVFLSFDSPFTVIHSCPSIQSPSGPDSFIKSLPSFLLPPYLKHWRRIIECVGSLCEVYLYWITGALDLPSRLNSHFPEEGICRDVHSAFIPLSNAISQTLGYHSSNHSGKSVSPTPSSPRTNNLPPIDDSLDNWRITSNLQAYA